MLKDMLHLLQSKNMGSGTTGTVSVCLCILFILACQEPTSKDLDLADNPAQVEIFAPGIISTGLYERDMAIDSSGTEMIYTLGDHKQVKRILVRRIFSGTGWSEPEMLPFSGEYHDIEPFLANRDRELFFASTRPMDADTTRKDYNIWRALRTAEGWSTPVPLDTFINTRGDEFYPAVSANGNLYFTATRPEGMGKEDLYISTFRDGEYGNPAPLDSSVNTAFYEFNAWISPDESLILFGSYGRPDGLGGGDLYYSRKNQDGTWELAKPFGQGINTPYLDYCPFVDIARGNLYFTSERIPGQGRPVASVQDLVELTSRPGNGMGDIYRIALDSAGIE